MNRTAIVNGNGQIANTDPNYAHVVVPSNTVDNVNNCYVYVGTGGNISALLSGNQPNDPPVTFKNINSGTLLRFSIRRILSTGTSATDLVQLYNV